ncbi:MAG: hypothetical protein O7F76_05365 [Planctomycetota bacterium]|nr:hypothetical protein [Planctomycetota bacterium]
MSVNPAELLQVAKAHIAADKKKSAGLGGLMLVLLVVVGRLLVGGSGPEEAKAKSIVVQPVEKRPAGPTMRPMPRRTKTTATPAGVGETVADFASFPDEDIEFIDDDLPRVLDRDIFAVPDWSLFARSSEPIEGKGAMGFQAGRLWARLAESMDSFKNQQSDEFKAQIAELQLRATVTGVVPVAYISGRIVREGDVIDGFSVARIGERQVTLRKFGHTGSIKLP